MPNCAKAAKNNVHRITQQKEVLEFGQGIRRSNSEVYKRRTKSASDNQMERRPEFRHRQGARRSPGGFTESRRPGHKVQVQDKRQGNLPLAGRRQMVRRQQGMKKSGRKAGYNKARPESLPGMFRKSFPHTGALPHASPPVPCMKTGPRPSPAWVC